MIIYHRCMFSISISLNIILIFLILTKSPKKLGTYKYFMIYFCCYAMVFSLVDYIVQPIIFIGQRTFVIGTISSLLTPSNMIRLVSILCGFFGSTLAIFVIHFMFRYFALERRGRLHYFQGKYLIFWFVSPLVPGSFWGYITYLFLQPGGLTIPIVQQLIYPYTLNGYSYISCTYFLPNGDFNTTQSLTMFTLTSVLVISIVIVGFFAMGSYKLINEILKIGESDYSRNLQKQLFRALLCQAVIPSSLMYIPVGCLCILPFFDITLPQLPTIVTITYAMYPAIDALPIIIIVDSYRNFVLRPFLVALNRPAQQITPDSS